MRQLVRGERAKLSELAAIHHLWDVEVSLHAPVYIVDYCCFGLDENGEVFDDAFVINFNRPDAPNGAIQLNNVANNGAVFSLALELLPPQVRRLVFTASLGESPLTEGLQSLGNGLVGGLVGAAFSLFGVNSKVGSGHLILATPAAEMAFFEFSGQDFGQSRTLILGEIYLREEWRFVAAGQPLSGGLGTFLRTLSDGPTPLSRAVALVKPRATAPPSAPARPTRPAVAPPVRTAPRPTTPVLSPARAASASVPVSSKPPLNQVENPPAPILATSVSTSDLRTPASAGPVLAVPNLPQSVARGEKLQDLVDAAVKGATLILQRGEYAGPITISKPLALEGQGSAIWAKNGPVITLTTAAVTLHDMDIEATAPDDASGETDVALRIKVGAQGGAALELDNVNLRGRIAGLGASDGTWKTPRALDLGNFAAREANNFHFSIEVPCAATLVCPVVGIEITPREIAMGTHQIRMQVRDIAPDTLLVGRLEVRTPELVFIVSLRGSAQDGVEAARDKAI